MEGPIRVLVVDDDPQLAQLVGECLPREDDRLEVVTATDARDGLDRLETTDVDCIVSDYEMPGMDGIDFLETVRERRPNLPFVLFTGQGSEEVAGEAISAGVTDYLRKTVDRNLYTLLANRVTNAVEHVRAEQARDRHRTAIENATEGISVLDADGRFVYVNDTYADLYGYAREELCGEHWGLLYPEDEVAVAREQILPTVERERYWHGETTGLRADGSTFVEDHTLATTDDGELICIVSDITERATQEGELHRLRERFERFADVAPNGLFLVSADYSETHFVNTGIGDIYGISTAEATADPEAWLRHVHPDDRADLERSLRQHHSSTPEWPVEQTFRIQHPDRGLRRVLVRMQAITDRDGEVVELAGVATDVTEQTERAADLELQSAAMEAATDGIAILDADGEFVYTNSAHADVFGYRPEDLVGESWRVLYGASEAARLDREVFPALERTGEWRGEAVGQTRVGDTVHVEVGLSLLSDGKIICTNRDITARKAREMELEATRERYESLFENNPLAIWEEDFSETKARLDELRAEVESVEQYLLAHPDELQAVLSTIEIIDVNQNAVDYYGAESKADLLDNLDRVFAEAAYDVLAAELAAIANGDRQFSGDTVYRSFDGEHHDEMLNLYVPESAADDYSHVFVTGTDISERKEKERELRRERDRLDEFAGFVSHDLRGPLNLASGYLALAREEHDSDSLAAVDRALGRMEQLITDLLRLAREGEAVGEVTPVSIGDLATQCWQHVETADARLEVASPPTVMADRSRLTTLLENVVRNAVEHGGTDVTITVGALADEAGFFVADDGAGVPRDDWDTVFESGYSTHSEGTGFGLAIVEQVAEAHGWEVSVTESTDGGARFEVTGVEVDPAASDRTETQHTP